MPTIPYVPETITVHLGAPSENAPNVTVTFPDYIKNVASSEIYPTWDESAIRANIYAQISYALNRVYTTFYRSQNYDFDITSSTAYDQKFINGRNFFDNIVRIVDEIFNEYIRRIGFIEPLAAKYCNGTTVTCEGLSQWGSENLAQQGYNSIDILRYYYGNNIELVTNAPIRPFTTLYPGYPVRRGNTGQSVIIIQEMINLISQDYPAIPKVYPVDGIFGENTENAVITFQRIFNLTPDGIVGMATWNRMVYLYTGILRLNELESEGQTLVNYSFAYPDAISEGDTGEKVTLLQYMLGVISQFYPSVPPIEADGNFGPSTRNAVIAFQTQFGLPQTGEVDGYVWDLIYSAYKGIIDETGFLRRPQTIPALNTGTEVMRLGSSGEAVAVFQREINTISRNGHRVNPVVPTGIFGQPTRSAVMNFQREMGLPQTGRADAETKKRMHDAYRRSVTSTMPSIRQYPGYELTLGLVDKGGLR